MGGTVRSQSGLSLLFYVRLMSELALDYEEASAVLSQATPTLFLPRRLPRAFLWFEERIALSFKSHRVLLLWESNLIKTAHLHISCLTKPL